MSEQFDPYLVWLGIRDPQRPPTFYRLLGVDLFEDDALVISNAADRQMAHVRTFQNGKHAQLSQQILNELAHAKLHLLNPQRKAEYDSHLRQMGYGQPAGAPPLSTPPQGYSQQPAPYPPPQPQLAQPQYAQPSSPQPSQEEWQPNFSSTTSVRKSSGSSGVMVFGLIGLTVAAAIGMMVLLFSPEKEDVGEDTVELISKTPKTSDNEPTKEQPTDQPSENAPTTSPEMPEEAEPKREGAWPTQAGAIYATAFSPTGKTALTVGEDGTLKIWKVHPGETLFTLPAHTGGSYALRVFNNGQMAATGGADQTLRVWSLETNEQAYALTGHIKPIRAVDVSENGQWAVSTGDDGTVRLWDLTTRKEARDYFNSVAPMHTVGLDAQNKWVAAAGVEGIVRIWDLESGSRLVDYRVSEQPIRQLALASRGQQMLTASEDTQLTLFKIEPGRDPTLVRQWTHPTSVTATAFSPNTACAISGAADGEVRLWTQNESEPIASWKLADSAIVHVAISPLGDLVLATDAVGHIQTWPLTPEQTALVLDSNDTPSTAVDAPPSELVRSWEAHTDWIRQVVFSPDGNQIASVADDGRVLLWDTKAETAEPIQITQLSGRTTRIAFSPAAEFLAIGTSEGKVHIWDIASERELKTVPLGSPITQLSFRARDQLFCAEANRLVYLWDWTSSDLPTGSPLGAYEDCWLPGPNGQVFSAGLDSHVRTWDFTMPEGSLLNTMETDKPLVSVASSRDGNWLYAGDLAGSVHIVANQNQVKAMATLKGHTGPIWTMAATPGLAISGGNDKLIKYWDLRSTEPYRTLEGHRGPLTSLAVSPDNRLLVSADRTGEMRLWKIPAVSPSPPAAALAGDSDNPRLEVPDKTVVEETKRKLRGQYSTQYAQRNHEIMLQLANTFLAEAAAEEINAAQRYALLDEARLISIQEGDVARALQAAELIAGRFEQELLPLQADTLQEILSTVRSLQFSGTANTASIQLMNLIDTARAENNYPVAARLGKAGNGLATRLNSRALGFYMQQINRTITNEQRRYDAVERAREHLAAVPGDPASHTAIGQFFTFVKEDWKQGLPHLAVGDNPALRQIAWQELRQPTTGEEKYRLAQAWKALSSETGESQIAAMKRALHWYYEADGDLDELTRAEADAAKKLIQQQLEKVTTVYLADIPPVQTTGPVDGSGKVIVQNQRPPKSILVAPNANDEVSIHYVLFKKFSTFRAIVAVPDNANLRGDMVFRVFGDGQELSVSQDFNAPAQQQTLEVDISGVHELIITMRTRADRRARPLGAWITPQLSTLKRRSPDLDFQSFGE